MVRLTKYFKSIAVFLFFIFPSIYFAQEIPNLITDRPDKSESAVVVPKDYFQIETGFLYQSQKFNENNIKTENDNLILGSTLCRYGLNSFFEFRFGGEYLYSQNFVNDKKNTLQGFQNILLGAKFQFRKDQKYISNAALIVQSIIPFGNINLKPERFEPIAIVCLSQDLPDGLSIGMNLGLEDNSQLSKTFFIYSLTTGINISNRINSFLEVFGSTAKNNSAINYIDFGLTYLYTQNIQVDFSLGTLITGPLTDIFGGLGLAIRLPR